MQQTISPNPYIPCKPGWCLAYVNQAFRVPIRYGSATAAWNGSATKHRDYNFPAGVWTPIWFSLKTEPNGHVALRAPDGRVFSTTHPTSLRPTEHPNLAHLISAYAQYNPLTYLGWTEDVEGTRVMAPSGLSPQGNITPITSEEDDMALDDTTKQWLKENLFTKADGAYQNNTLFSKEDGAWQNGLLLQVLANQSDDLNKEDGGYIVGLLQAVKPGSTDASAIAEALVKAIGKDIAAEVVTALGQKLVN